VVTRSFCGVYQNYFSDAIATLADLDNVINTQTDQAVTEGVVWALALEKSQVTGPGRVVICGDSGWLGSENSKSPGPGESASWRRRSTAVFLVLMITDLDPRDSLLTSDRAARGPPTTHGSSRPGVAAGPGQNIGWRQLCHRH
jgi:hypothetical protein